MRKIKFNKNASIGTAVFSAVSLKLCCWGPLLLTSIAGVSGSSIYFSWLIALKPYLLLVAFVSLAFAFYQVYKIKKDPVCSGNCKAEKTSFLRSKLYLWSVAGFVVLMTVISYAPQIFHFPTEKKIVTAYEENIEAVKFSIEGMICEGCEGNINNAVNKLEGVLQIKTSHRSKTSEIEFDKSKTSVTQIKELIESRGYLTKIISNE